MELENIVANTVLLKAREGKDVSGRVDCNSLRVSFRDSPGPTAGLMPQTWGLEEELVHFLIALLSKLL